MTEWRHAWRTLWKQPAFAVGAIAVLTLAIGANTAMFTLVRAIVLQPLPLRDPDRLITFTILRPGTDRQPFSLPDLADIIESNRTLDGVASMFGWSANMTGSGDAERLSGMRVSANYFELTGTDVAWGRPIRPDDAQRMVAVLGHGLWQRRFGADRDIVGRTIVLNGESFAIVGVLREDFVSLVRDAEVVVPYSPATDVRRHNRAQGFLRLVGRLKPDVTVGQAGTDLTAIVRRLSVEYPDAHGADVGVRVATCHEEIVGRSAPMLWILLAAVALVMVVACANLANLFLVRGAERRREMALRSALGASRLRVIAQSLSEAAIVGVTGGLLGLLVARMVVDVVLAIAPAGLPRVAEVAIDWGAALFTLLLSLGTSAIVGSVPALQALRGDVRGALQHGDRGSSVGGGRLRATLVFAEVTLSTLLLVSAALLARSFSEVQAIDPGFRPSHVLTVRISLPRARYANRAAIENFYHQVQPRLASVPGVDAAAAANVVPMNGYLATIAFYTDGTISRDAPDAHYRMISPDYFRALGIGLLQGRGFSATDRNHTLPVAIVNQTLARNYLGGRNPLGARLRLDDGEKVPREVEIVGVVGDVRHFGLEREATLEVYVPIAQVPDPTTIWLANNMYWVIHTAGEPLASANAVRREIAAVDPSVPASFVRSMDQWLGGTLAARRFNLQVVVVFATAALLLASVGVYAVSSAVVSSRTREIGIRAAMGASRLTLVTLVLRGAAAPVLAGLAAGIVVALFVAQALSAMLFGIAPADPVSIGVSAAMLTTASLLANLIPALRAMRVDPVIALRAL